MSSKERQSKVVRKRSFQWRAYVSLFLLLAGGLLVLSGFVLYVAPSGRIAKTVEWRLLWLDKTQWEALHTVLGFVAVFFSYLHVKYNWRPIVSYLRRKVGEATRLRKELLVATLSTLILVVWSAANLPPVRQLMDFGESFNGFWEVWGENRGYFVVSEEEAHPEGDAAAPQTGPPAGAEEETPSPSSKGYGRLSVRDLAERESVPLETALKRLAASGVEAGAGNNLLTLSGRSGYTPGELAAIIRGEGP